MSRIVKYGLIGAGILAVGLWCAVMFIAADEPIKDPRYYSPRG